MGTWAAAMTGKGTGAIATVQVLGDGAVQIVSHIFRPAGPSPAHLTPGCIALGAVADGQQILDQVVVGCEDHDLFAIHCHGNPLILESIMALVEAAGARLVSPEVLLAKVYSAGGADAIEVEARLVQLKARTLEGVRLIANQARTGLGPMVLRWRDLPPHAVQEQAREVLANSVPGRLITHGCTAVIAGPPNTGKSTLLNWLAGRDKAIVTGLGGTTRDCVRAECRVGPLCLDLIDTAGLSANLTSEVDQAAQDKTLQAIEAADLVLLVLDVHQPADQIHDLPLDRLAAKPLLTVLNKSDLATRLKGADLPSPLTQTLRVSARCQTELGALAQAICQACGVTGFALETPVVFTPRQRRLVERLADGHHTSDATATITQLLHGPVAEEGSPA